LYFQEKLRKDTDASEVMDCLIENKFEEGMNDKCRAGIEHHQIVSTVL